MISIHLDNLQISRISEVVQVNVSNVNRKFINNDDIVNKNKKNLGVSRNIALH